MHAEEPPVRRPNSGPPSNALQKQTHAQVEKGGREGCEREGVRVSERVRESERGGEQEGGRESMCACVPALSRVCVAEAERDAAPALCLPHPTVSGCAVRGHLQRLQPKWRRRTHTR